MTERVIEIDGFQLLIDSLDSLGLAAAGSFEPEVLEAITRWIAPGQHVLDIGANIGYFALHAARRVGPTGRVDAFEPAPENLRILRRNVCTHGMAQVTVHPLALGAAAGTAALHLSTANGGMHRLYDSVVNDGPKVEVAVTTVDTLFPDAEVDLIKIDVEGYEMGVLLGAEQCLRRSPRLRLIAEFCAPTSIEAGFSPVGMIRFLAGLGLQPHALSGTPIDPQELIADALRFEAFGRAALLARCEGLDNAGIFGSLVALAQELHCQRPPIENLLFMRPQA